MNFASSMKTNKNSVIFSSLKWMEDLIDKAFIDNMHLSRMYMESNIGYFDNINILIEHLQGACGEIHLSQWEMKVL